jgi:uncharacterized RDD family membrane protein YckC
MESTSPARPVALPAAPGWRLLAFVYDLLPMIPLMMAVSALFLWIHGGRPLEPGSLMMVLERSSILGLVGLYFVLSWRRGGMTLGMRPWRLRVLAADGKPAAWRALWIRYFVALLLPGVCWLWCFFDAERRGLHDVAAKTLLVRLQPNL